MLHDDFFCCIDAFDAIIKMDIYISFDKIMSKKSSQYFVVNIQLKFPEYPFEKCHLMLFVAENTCYTIFFKSFKLY